MNRRTHVIKFVHAILPTNSRIHRDKHVHSLCPCCRQRREDWIHIIKCDSPSRSEWREAMIQVIDKKCENLNTVPELRAILITALKAWTTRTESDMETQLSIDPSTASSPVSIRMIAHQNEIGWQHVFLGRFCHEWSDVQEAHYANMLNTKERKSRTGQRWQQEIINTIWTQWFLVWEMRNKDLHGANECTRARAGRKLKEHCVTSTIYASRWSPASNNSCVRISLTILQNHYGLTKIG
jgi:hypothetical protein